MHQTPKRAILSEIRDRFSFMYFVVFFRILTIHEEMHSGILALPFCVPIWPPIFTVLYSWLAVQTSAFPPPHTFYYTYRIQVFSPGGDLEISSNLLILQTSVQGSEGTHVSISSGQSWFVCCSSVLSA